MVSELTGTYQLLIPAMWVFDYFSPVVKRPLWRHRYLSRIRQRILVTSSMTCSLTFGLKRCLTPNEKWCSQPSFKPDDCKQLVTQSNQTVYPVVDSNGNLCGIFNMNDLRSFLYDDMLGMVAVADDIATKDMIVLKEHDTLLQLRAVLRSKNLKSFSLSARTKPAIAASWASWDADRLSATTTKWWTSSSAVAPMMATMSTTRACAKRPIIRKAMIPHPNGLAFIKLFSRFW